MATARCVRLAAAGEVSRARKDNRTGPFADLALIVAIFTVEVVLSNAWLERFNFGPLEWLLRAFAYLRLPHMKADMT